MQRSPTLSAASGHPVRNPRRSTFPNGVLLKILHVRNVRRPSFSKSSASRRFPSAVSAKSSASRTLRGCLLQNPPRAERSEAVFFRILRAPNGSECSFRKILRVRNARRVSSSKSSTSGTLGARLFQNPPRSDGRKVEDFVISGCRSRFRLARLNFLHVLAFLTWRILSMLPSGAF